MDIGLHEVKRVMVDKVRRLSTGCYTRNMHVVTADGRVNIALFAEDADKLAIVTVEDYNDFYEGEAGE